MWGLQQFGIRAVVASSYAEIFYSNAMNNRLLLVTLPPEAIAQADGRRGRPVGQRGIDIDITAQTLRSRSVQAELRTDAAPPDRCSSKGSTASGCR